MTKSSKSADPVTALRIVELRSPSTSDRAFVRDSIRHYMGRPGFTWAKERAVWAASVATMAERGSVTGIALYGWRVSDRMLRFVEATHGAGLGRRAPLSVVR